MKSEGKKITVLVQIRISNWSKNGTENVCWDEWLVVVAKPWHAKTCYANLKRLGNSKRPESLILISFVKVFTFLMQQHFSWVNQTIFQVLEYSEDDYWGSRQCQWTGGGTFGQVERGFSTSDVFVGIVWSGWRCFRVPFIGGLPPSLTSFRIIFS